MSKTQFMSQFNLGVVVETPESFFVDGRVVWFALNELCGGRTYDYPARQIALSLAQSINQHLSTLGIV